MSKEYFVDNISDETITKMIDKALKFEKNNKSEKIKTNWAKIIPAVAMILFMVGIVSVFTFIANINNDIASDTDNMGQTGEPENVYESTGEILSFVPPVVEKEFFENRVLAAITSPRDLSSITAYYRLKEPSEASFNDPKVRVPVYVLDPNISERELNTLLEYYQQYTNLTGDDIMQMYTDFAIPYENYKTSVQIFNERYSHVRFGKDKNTLLLDIEWHTYESYLEWIEEFHNIILPEYRKTDDYMIVPDIIKEKYESNYTEYRKIMEERAELIKENRAYQPRLINGIAPRVDNWGIADWVWDLDGDISEFLDENGYYILQIYPYNHYIVYLDENCEYQFETFGTVNSKSEFDQLLEDKIKPFCDDLVARNLMGSFNYSLQMKDPLDKLVYLLFFD